METLIKGNVENVKENTQKFVVPTYCTMLCKSLQSNVYVNNIHAQKMNSIKFIKENAVWKLLNDTYG
jgi:hypothetical protein